jgi:hypothetical protein
MNPARMRIERALASAGLWAAMVLVAGLPAVGAEPQHQDLQGTWELNPDLTAQLMKDAQKQASPGGRRGGGMGGGMGRHRGGGGGGGGSRGGGAAPAAGGGGGAGPRGGGPPPAVGGSGGSGAGESRDEGQGRQGWGASLDKLIIVQKDAQITITDAEGRVRIVKADGSKARDETAPGGPAQVQATWDKDGSLLVEVKPDKGSTRTESYVVSNDRKHLYLTLTVSRRFRGETQIVRAYDPAPAPPAPEEAKPAQTAPPTSPPEPKPPPPSSPR